MHAGHRQGTAKLPSDHDFDIPDAWWSKAAVRRYEFELKAVGPVRDAQEFYSGSPTRGIGSRSAQRTLALRR
jgi:hypothetical protein